MKNIRRSLIIIMAISISLFSLLAGCGGNDVLAVDTSNATTVFEVGAEFSSDGLVVYNKKPNGDNIRIKKTDYTISTPDMTTVGEKTITVTFGENTVTYKINVVVPEVVATFKGDIVAGLGDFLCYNTNKWELCYADTHPALPGRGSYGVKDSGSYKVIDGNYSIVLTTNTAVSSKDATSGEVTFSYTGVGLPIAGGLLTGTFNGVMTLQS